MKFSTFSAFFLALGALVVFKPALGEQRNFLEAAPVAENGASASETPQAEQALSDCLKAALTEEDKDKLALMIFMIMSHNPAVRDLSQIDAARTEKISRDSAKVFESLILDRCLDQTHRVLRASGFNGIGNSFESLNYPLMYRLLKHPVSDSIAMDFYKYLDEDRLQREFKGY
jgi:hypothetical protein